jgi:hypothetical protein
MSIFGQHKKLYFHLLKFPRTENIISWGYFVAKSFTYLSNTKWDFNPASINHVAEIGENSLSGFWT